MTFQYAGPTSVFIPQAQPGLFIAFSRNREGYKALRCVQRVPVTAIQGKFLRLDPDAGYRIRTQRANWPDGRTRPTGFSTKHEWADFSCERSSENFRTGNLTIEQARAVTGWDKLGTDLGVAANLAMTNLTYEVEQLVTNPDVIPKADCAATVGGVLAGSSESNAYIQKAISHGVNQIITATRGAVQRENIMVLMGRTLAEAIAQSPEYFAYQKNYAQALNAAMRTGNVDRYGLLPDLWGVEPVVFGDVFVTSADGLAVTTRNAFEGLGTVSGFDIDEPLIFMARPKGPAVRETAPVGVDSGVPEIQSDIHGALLMPTKEEMTVQVESNEFHRVTSGAVTNNYDLVLSSTRSIYMLGECYA